MYCLVISLTVVEQMIRLSLTLEVAEVEVFPEQLLGPYHRLIYAWPPVLNRFDYVFLWQFTSSYYERKLGIIICGLVLQ